jgi:hypothetical protein
MSTKKKVCPKKFSSHRYKIHTQYFLWRKMTELYTVRIRAELTIALSQLTANYH